jgi:hypothetical protein
MAMNEPTPVPDFLLQRLGLIGSRVRFYRVADGNLIREIRCGVIFIMAFWSAPSVKAIAPFVGAVVEEDPTQVLEVVVVDNDGLHDWDLFPEIRGLDGGWGELVAVYDGRIVGTSGFGFRPETYRTIVRSLVDWNRNHEIPGT